MEGDCLFNYRNGLMKEPLRGAVHVRCSEWNVSLPIFAAWLGPIRPQCYRRCNLTIGRMFIKPWVPHIYFSLFNVSNPTIRYWDILIISWFFFIVWVQTLHTANVNIIYIQNPIVYELIFLDYMYQVSKIEKIFIFLLIIINQSNIIYWRKKN